MIVLYTTRVAFLLTVQGEMGEQNHIMINIVQYRKVVQDYITDPRIVQATHSDYCANQVSCNKWTYSILSRIAVI